MQLFGILSLLLLAVWPVYADQTARYKKFMHALSQDKVTENKFILPDHGQQTRLNNDVGYFISFSMTDLAIKETLQQADQYGIPIYINGLINDSLADTTKKFMQLFGESSNKGLGIDPIRFSAFNVKTVPTLIVKCGQKIDKLTGNIPLKTALKKIAEEGDCANQVKELPGDVL